MSAISKLPSKRNSFEDREKLAFVEEFERSGMKSKAKFVQSKGGAFSETAFSSWVDLKRKGAFDKDLLTGRKRCRPAKYGVVEAKLVQFIKAHQQVVGNDKVGLSHSYLRGKALEIAKAEMTEEEAKEFSASAGWLANVMSRNKLCCFKRHGEYGEGNEMTSRSNLDGLVPFASYSENDRHSVIELNAGLESDAAVVDAEATRTDTSEIAKGSDIVESLTEQHPEEEVEKITVTESIDNALPSTHLFSPEGWAACIAKTNDFLDMISEEPEVINFPQLYQLQTLVHEWFRFMKREKDRHDEKLRRQETIQ